HEHLRPTDGGEQPDLRRPDYAARAYRHVTGLHVVTDPADVVTRADGAGRGDVTSLGGGPPDRQDRVRERGQRRAGVHADGLAGLQPGRLAGSRGDLTDDGQARGPGGAVPALRDGSALRGGTAD